ncbi:hypothetical protein J1614_005876 [Plenodomus biglobosus]|nr:hypothetical protein J1614_005876 [Plenodomus biglobosus]
METRLGCDCITAASLPQEKRADSVAGGPCPSQPHFPPSTSALHQATLVERKTRGQSHLSLNSTRSSTPAYPPPRFLPEINQSPILSSPLSDVTCVAHFI